ncbi:FecR family protein [Porticoccus sp. GXU_MW_L64]
MSNIYQLSDREKRFDEASLWVSRLDKGLSDADEQALKQWLDAEEQNREVFLKMAEVWDKMDALGRLTYLFPQPVRHRDRAPWFSPALAASFVAVVFAALWVFSAWSPEGGRPPTVAANMQGLYQTAVGESSSIELPDGTLLALNTNTSVRVNYTQNQRLLVLEHGEINVDVAHDEARPLSVVVGDQIIQAVGTQFNIELTSEQKIELVVTDGKVLVGINEKPIEGSIYSHPVVLPDNATPVSKGQQLVLGAAEQTVEIIEAADIEVKLSWRDGNLVFRGESLENAVAEVSRYTSVEFVFRDEDLKAVRIAGLFKAGDVNGLLQALRENFDISYERNDGKIVLGAP